MNSSPSFILKHGRFGVEKLGNIHEPPMHAAMHQSVEAGPRWHSRGAAAPLVGPARDRLRVVGS